MLKKEKKCRREAEPRMGQTSEDERPSRAKALSVEVGGGQLVAQTCTARVLFYTDMTDYVTLLFFAH